MTEYMLALDAQSESISIVVPAPIKIKNDSIYFHHTTFFVRNFLS